MCIRDRVNSALMPSAAATGMRKRRVEPDSPQSSWAQAGGLETGVTKAVSPFRRMQAPSAVRQRMVASISSDRVRPRTSPGRSARAAKIR